MSATTNQRRNRSQTFRKVQLNIEKRISLLPQEARNDLIALCTALNKAGDEAERLDIAQTITEIVFPESLSSQICEEVEQEENVDVREHLDEYRRNVGAIIRKRRLELDMTQEQLAVRAGIPQSHVCRLEPGVHAPTHKTMQKIAKALRTRAALLDPGFG